MRATECARFFCLHRGAASPAHWPLIARSSKTKVRKPLIQGHELGSSHQLMSQLSSDSHISFMTRATMLEKIFTAQTSDTLALINAPYTEA